MKNKILILSLFLLLLIGCKSKPVYVKEKQKTHPQKWDGSNIVAGTGLEPVTFGL